MSVESMQLPSDPVALCRILDQHCMREHNRLAFRRTMWLFAWWYLNGARRFEVFNPMTGAITPSYLDTEGNVEFQLQELLSAINRNAGRIAGMDLSPKVFRGDGSLGGIRDRSVAQVVADSLVSVDQLERIKNEFAYLFTCLGFAGLTGHIVDHPTIGLTGDLEVIHPKELFPFPSLGQDHTKVRGLVRERTVPIAFLKEKFGKGTITSKMEGMEWFKVPYGTSLEKGVGDSTISARSISPYKDMQGKIVKKAEDMHLDVAVVRELWLMGPRDTCQRYVCTSGEALFEDADYSEQEVYCPIGYSRFFENGTFHGAGVFDLMFSICREMERLLKSLFNNIRDTDRYGFVVMPSGSWNERAALREVGKGLRVLPWEPDPQSEGFRPFAVQPFNLGDVPGKVAAFAGEMADKINPYRDLLKEKGRVDSMSGLQFLDEQVSKAVTIPSRGVQQAFGNAYRAMVSQARTDLLVSPKPLPVTRLELDLAGVVIDSEKNTVSFEVNPIPELSRLSFGVRETSPKSMIAQKTELVELFKLGQMPWDRFILTALQKGLDFTMWTADYQSAYDMVIRNCLLLYGNGKEPGEIIITPTTTKPDFQLLVLDAFMSDIRMALASPEVQDAFKAYKETLLQWTGAALPEGTPNPEDAAMQTQMAAEQMMMAGPGGMPVPGIALSGEAP